VVSSLGVLVAVLSAFGPIVAFFSITTISYHFVLLMDVFVFAVAGMFGMSFLYRTLQRRDAAGPPVSAGADEEDIPEVTEEVQEALPVGRDASDSPPLRRRGVGPVFAVWVVLFAVVGGQMAWLLRPFIGPPEGTFTWLAPRQSSFLEAVLQAIRVVCGG
jgi:hypothetical protein